MIRYLLATILAFVVSPALAVSFVADLPDQTTTHCAWRFDSGAWGADRPVVTISGVRLCTEDASSVSEGAHTVEAKAVKLNYQNLASNPSQLLPDGH